MGGGRSTRLGQGRRPTPPREAVERSGEFLDPQSAKNGLRNRLVHVGQNLLCQEPPPVEEGDGRLADDTLTQLSQRPPLAHRTERVWTRGQLGEIPLEPEVDRVLRVPVPPLDQVQLVPLGAGLIFVAPAQPDHRQSTPCSGRPEQLEGTGGLGPDPLDRPGLHLSDGRLGLEALEEFLELLALVARSEVGRTELGNRGRVVLEDLAQGRKRADELDQEEQEIEQHSRRSTHGRNSGEAGARPVKGARGCIGRPSEPGTPAGSQDGSSSRTNQGGSSRFLEEPKRQRSSTRKLCSRTRGASSEPTSRKRARTVGRRSGSARAVEGRLRSIRTRRKERTERVHRIDSPAAL